MNKIALKSDTTDGQSTASRWCEDGQCVANGVIPAQAGIQFGGECQACDETGFPLPRE
jgi:hypothetical protein